MIGQTLGHYRILEKIGAGGMGEVYRASDERLQRDVALKVLPAGTLADEAARTRFRKEALALSKLNHPNIATIFDFDTQDGVDFLVMEHIRGVTLNERLAQGPLPEREVIRLGAQMAEGLAEGHKEHIVHRDIKPGNLRVTPEGRVKILDFGLAKVVRPVTGTSTTAAFTETQAVRGTLPYMAPEQLRGEKVNVRSDIWALGCVLYEMASGRRPFPERDALQLSAAILEKAPRTPRELSQKVSPGLENIILKALEKDPERRYQSAKELRVDLVRLSAGPTVVTAPSRQLAGRPWRLAAGIALGLVVLVAALVLFRLLGPQPPAQPLTIKPLTSFVGLEWGPSLSPDASFLAYAHNRYGHMDIFVLSTGGGEPVRLTNNPADDLTPRWSPDGRYIGFLSDRGTGTNVYLIPVLGGAERKLAETDIPWLEGAVETLYALGATPWSPDASELLFSRMSPSGEIAVWKINLSTGLQTQLTRPPPGAVDLYASWSFDGRRIAFSRNQGGKSSLWLVDAHGGQPELLLGDEFINMTPAWSADGRRLVFVSNRSGPFSLWEIEVRSHRLRQVTTGSGTDVMPAVALTGDLAYTTYSHQVDLYWGPVDQPQEKHERLTSHTRNNFGGRVSPDGRHVVYQSDRTGNYELWLLDRRRGVERNLTDNPAWDAMGDWSPDGLQLVFLSNRQGTSLQPWILEVDGGQARRLSKKSRPIPFEPHFSGPRWSPDGKLIGFLSAGELWVVDPQGRNERSLLAGVIGFDWYRDSRHLLYTARGSDGSLEMRLGNLETGEQVVLLHGPTAELVVSRDGREVAFLHSVSHLNMQLSLLRLAPPASPGGLPRLLGEPEQLTHGESAWHVHNGGWSPDGKAIVYTRDNDSGDVYVIKNYR